ALITGVESSNPGPRVDLALPPGRRDRRP
ncbi:LOW QUALITY PROTEIN: cold shock protein, partial [Mycobacterium tuberculosis variant africanum K85]